MRGSIETISFKCVGGLSITSGIGLAVFVLANLIQHCGEHFTWEIPHSNPRIYGKMQRMFAFCVYGWESNNDYYLSASVMDDSCVSLDAMF